MEALLLILLVAAVVALIGVAGLWRGERRRASELEDELARERAKPSRATAPPPLKAVLQTAARVREEGLGEVLRSSFEELAGLAEEVEQPSHHLLARVVPSDRSELSCADGDVPTHWAGLDSWEVWSTPVSWQTRSERGLDEAAGVGEGEPPATDETVAEAGAETAAPPP